MTCTLSQPDARPISDDVLAAVLTSLAPELAGAEPVSVRHHDSFSNDLAELAFPDGRRLMVKRGRYEWSGPQFHAARLASGLVRARAGVLAPVPLPVPDALSGELAIEAYWRIDLPTLAELLPGLSGAERGQALRSWGELLRRVHSIRMPAHGPLAPTDESSRSAEEHLRRDLEARLLPAAFGCWSEGAPLIERLLDFLSTLGPRLAGRGAHLLHGDMHAGNVLCSAEGSRVRCVGLLDLETAVAGLPEMDLARAEVLHYPLFGQPLPDGWSARLLEGYREAPDPQVLAFCRGYNLANLGFYSGLVGHVEHAAEVAVSLESVVASAR